MHLEWNGIPYSLRTSCDQTAPGEFFFAMVVIPSRSIRQSERTNMGEAGWLEQRIAIIRATAASAIEKVSIQRTYNRLVSVLVPNLVFCCDRKFVTLVLF